MSQFIFNESIYSSSIITSRELHVSCYTAPILNCMSVLLIFIYCLYAILFLYAHEPYDKLTFC
jgi:hypothetical protein